MTIKKYYTASIWLGILPILIVSLAWMIGLYMQPLGESVFFLLYSFASAINAFFFSYVLSVLCIRVVELSGSGRKLAFLKKLWWMGFVLMVLFWILIGISGLFPSSKIYLDGATVYPPLHSLNKQKDFAIDGLVNDFLRSLFLAIVISISILIQSFILFVSIATSRQFWRGILRKITTILTIILCFVGITLSLIFLLGIGLLVIDYFFATSFFLSDIYISGSAEGYKSAPKSMLLPYLWEALFYILFFVLIFSTLKPLKQLSKLSIGFGLVSIIILVKRVYYPEGTTSLQFRDTLITMHSSSEIWYMFFGLMAIVYQLVTWNKQQLIQWLAYLHLTITSILSLMLLFKKRFYYYSFSSEDVMLDYYSRIEFFVLIFITISQSFLLINYWLSNYHKAKPSVG